MGAGPKTDISDERLQFEFQATANLPVALEPAYAPLTKRRTKLPSVLFGQLILRLSAAIGEALSREGARGTTFLLVPVLMGAGALFYFLAPSEPETGFIVISTIGLAVATLASRSRYLLHLGLTAILLFALGIALGKLEVWRMDTKMLGSDVSTRVVGRVAKIEGQANGRVRLTIDVAGTSRPKLRYAPDRIRATAREVPNGLAAGDGVTGVVRLMSPSGPVRPNGYDFSFESYFDGIGAVGFFMTNPERADLPGEPGLSQRLTAGFEAMRQALADRIRRHISGADGEIAAALVAGARAGIPEEMNEALRDAGLAHILSISGLHMALVTVTVMQAIRLGFGLFPAFASRYPVKKFAAGAALCAAAFYLFMSGNAVAAQRSFIMLAVMLVALLFDRSAITMRNLAIATIIVLAASPHEIVGPSFQMSFAATMALIAVYTGWSEARAGRSGTPPTGPSPTRSALRAITIYAIGLAVTSIVAGIATTLFAIWHFQRAAPLGLIGNLLAMPVVSTLVMPFGVLGVALMPIGLEGPPLFVMGKGIAATTAIAQWVSELAPNDATGILPASAVLLLSAALVTVCLPTTRLRLLALPLAVVGALTVWQRDLPDLLISEDARLVGLRLEDGTMGVNRDRPNGFTSENWLSALASDKIVKPQMADSSAASDAPETTPEGTFICYESYCITRHSSGAVVVHTAEQAAARAFCGTATLIVIDDATAKNVCRPGSATVVTKRDVARRGSASVSFRDSEGASAADLTFSIAEPWRPWHEHRAYSRAARGLPPYERKKRNDDEKRTNTALLESLRKTSQ
ncbi:MAG TPA: ComEC/Rec2 family competence protein [Rhizobiaceae bacterium]|nr:ComEC/Rec2 family competence protein [Rhizobiaceae bacterium]